MKGTVIIVACVVILTLYAYATLKSTKTDDNERSSEHKNKFLSNTKPLRLDDRPDHLFWFVQVSKSAPLYSSRELNDSALIRFQIFM